MSFSKRLSDAMKERKISTRALSEMTGVPKSAIQRYTSGETEKIPIDRMKRMAEALDISPAYIMGWDEISDALGSNTPVSQKLRGIGEQLQAPSLKHLFPDKPDVCELVDIYDSLNDLGQQTLLGTARGLAANPDMKSGDVNA